MKCPKCNYIGFEPTDRCRNCGFDFSLAAAGQADPDLPLRSTELAGPLADFDLGEARRPPRVTPAARMMKRRQDPSLDPGVRPASDSDLPLFGELLPDEAPLVRSSAPSAPLSVRRSTPAPTRSRPSAVSRVPDRQPDLSLPLDSMASEAVAGSPSLPGRETGGEVAAVGPRIGAAALDWLMLLALDVAVVYFTLRVSRLALADVLLLPPAPLVAFLLLLNGGYLVLFTAASGQTIGKMAFGLKVVSAEDGPVTMGRALVRVVVFLISALPAGLGLLPAAFDHARRGLHDRLADTRVVRAAAS
jgi:uncharacterized RDD family membrane protein YckC